MTPAVGAALRCVKVLSPALASDGEPAMPDYAAHPAQSSFHCVKEQAPAGGGGLQSSADQAREVGKQLFFPGDNAAHFPHIFTCLGIIDQALQLRGALQQ